MGSCRLTIASVFLIAMVGCAEDTADVEQNAGADLILTNARVYTLNWNEPAADGSLDPSAPNNGSNWHPDAEAVVTQGGDILYVGTTKEALTYQADATRVIDLAGATVIPGLVDSHTHVFGLGAALDRVNLVDVATEEEAVALIVDAREICACR